MVIKPELSGGWQGSVVQLFKESDQRGFDVFAASVFRELCVQWPIPVFEIAVIQVLKRLFSDGQMWVEWFVMTA